MHEILYETGFAIEITENNTNLTEEGWNDCIIIYDKLIDITTKALEFLKVNKEAKNPRWIKGVERNFVSIEKMVQKIESYQHRRTMPLT